MHVAGRAPGGPPQKAEPGADAGPAAPLRSTARRGFYLAYESSLPAGHHWTYRPRLAGNARRWSLLGSRKAFVASRVFVAGARSEKSI